MNQTMQKLRNRKIIILGLYVVDIVLIVYAIYALITYVKWGKDLWLPGFLALVWNVFFIKFRSVLCICKNCGTKISTWELLKKTDTQCPHCKKDFTSSL